MNQTFLMDIFFSYFITHKKSRKSLTFVTTGYTPLNFIKFTNPLRMQRAVYFHFHISSGYWYTPEVIIHK